MAGGLPGATRALYGRCRNCGTHYLWHVPARGPNRGRTHPRSRCLAPTCPDQPLARVRAETFIRAAARSRVEPRFVEET